MKNSYLDGLLLEAERSKKKIVDLFQPMDKIQLNWKPNEEQWSIGQCLDHIITTNKQYFPILQRIIKGESTGNFWEKIPFLPKMYGNMILKAVSPEYQKRSKTFPIFEPTSSTIEPNILEEFKAIHTDLIQMVNKTDEVDHDHLKVTSPVNNFITYSLKDCITIIIKHQERHLNQATRLTEIDLFPRSSVANS